jgi:chromosome partitioning protein
VIVFANEKGGVGKSTLAFHCAVALCDAGAKVAVLDLDLRQQSLSLCIENRNRTARCLKVDLPTPRQVALHQQNGSQLSQEIARIGRDCDFVVIDLAGHDSPVARYAIALADKLVTPINSSTIDLDLLGKFDPVSGQLKKAGHFSQLVNALNEARLARGMGQADWIVAKNRVRSAEKKQQIRFENALQQLAANTGFRVSQGLNERVVYRELLPFGLTHLDLKRIPGLARKQGKARDEVLQLVADLNLREINQSIKIRKPSHRAKVSEDVAGSFAASLHAHANPTPQAS